MRKLKAEKSYFINVHHQMFLVPENTLYITVYDRCSLICSPVLQECFLYLYQLLLPSLGL